MLLQDGLRDGGACRVQNGQCEDLVGKGRVSRVLGRG